VCSHICHSVKVAQILSRKQQIVLTNREIPVVRASSDDFVNDPLRTRRPDSASERSVTLGSEWCLSVSRLNPDRRSQVKNRREFARIIDPCDGFFAFGVQKQCSQEVRFVIRPAVAAAGPLQDRCEPARRPQIHRRRRPGGVGGTPRQAQGPARHHLRRCQSRLQEQDQPGADAGLHRLHAVLLRVTRRAQHAGICRPYVTDPRRGRHRAPRTATRRLSRQG
jgi:hypothetical protein